MEMEWLPAGAVKIEYLQSDGTSWINPNILAQGGTYIDIKFSVTSYGQNFPCMSHNTDGTNGYDRNFFYVSSNSNISCMKCGSSASISCTFNINEPHSFVYNTQGTNFIGILDGETKFEYSNTNVLSSSAGYLGIFKNMYSNAISSAIKIYYLKINHIRDFIPVRINSAGYLYDKVSKQLFGNAGSGNFVLGPDL